MPTLEAKVVWSKGSWERRDFLDIEPSPILSYTMPYQHGDCGNVQVSTGRLWINGVRVHSQEERIDLADILQRAWRQHLHLKQGNREPLEEF